MSTILQIAVQYFGNGSYERIGFRFYTDVNGEWRVMTMRQSAYHEGLFRYFVFLAVMPLIIVLSFPSFVRASLRPLPLQHRPLAPEYPMNGFREIEIVLEADFYGFVLEFKQECKEGQPFMTRFLLKSQGEAESSDSLFLMIHVVLECYPFRAEDREHILQAFQRCYLQQQDPVVINEFQDNENLSWHGAVSANTIVLAKMQKGDQVHPDIFIPNETLVHPSFYLGGEPSPMHFKYKSAKYQKSFGQYAITVSIEGRANVMSTIRVDFTPPNFVVSDFGQLEQDVFSALAPYPAFLTEDIRHFARAFAKSKMKGGELSMQGKYPLRNNYSETHGWQAIVENNSIRVERK